MKIDYHSHILPGLDDGATTLQNAVELVSAMASWGFEKIYCTPHINAKYPNTPSDIREAFELLQDAVSDQVQLAMSAEYRLVPETWPEVLEKNWIMPIEDKYILTELPISHREEMREIKPLEEFKKLLSMGLTPILPHPERYFYLSHEELLRFVDAGVVIQCNYGSLAGLYGPEAQDRAFSLVSEGIVSLYGTDMHNLKYVEIIGNWFAQGNKIQEI
jgi:tyrosine-protein phosphatase YwqE